MHDAVTVQEPRPGIAGVQKCRLCGATRKFWEWGNERMARTQWKPVDCTATAARHGSQQQEAE